MSESNTSSTNSRVENSTGNVERMGESRHFLLSTHDRFQPITNSVPSVRYNDTYSDVLCRDTVLHIAYNMSFKRKHGLRTGTSIVHVYQKKKEKIIELFCIQYLCNLSEPTSDDDIDIFVENVA